MTIQRSIILPILGSLFGVATGFLSTYDSLGSFLGNPAPIMQLMIEAGLWTLWVAIQGLGFYVIYMKNKQSIFVGTGVVGLFAMVIEIVTLYQIWNSIEDIAIAIIGISVTILYLLMAGYSMTLLRPNDSLGKVSGYTFIVTSIVLLVFPPVGFAILGLSNLLAVAYFLTYDQKSLIEDEKGVSLM